MPVLASTLGVEPAAAAVPQWRRRRTLRTARWGCCRRAGAVTAAAVVLAPPCPPVAEASAAQVQRLRQWVEEAGGAVHPALQLADPAPCGARGVVATRAVPTEEAAATPLIVVPEAVFMTTEAARLQLAPTLSAAGAPALDALDGRLQLAVLLAHEAACGGASRWSPYIQSLPKRPPCAWLMEGSELDAATRAMGLSGAEWAAEAAAARRGVDAQCAALSKAYRRVLPALSEGALRWALGQVMSRSFGEGADLALMPFIDLCNHDSAAMAVDGFEDGDGRWYAAVWAARGEPEQPAPLAAGEEVLISYRARCARTCFLSFGWVPLDLR